jgi:hypothetical protein
MIIKLANIARSFRTILILQNGANMQDTRPYSVAKQTESDVQESYVLNEKKQVEAINVEVSQTPLTEEEKAILAGDLKRRNLSVGLLDVLPPKGKMFHLLRAYDQEKQLLAITVALSVFPFVALKNMLGEGNHVGWDISFYFATNAPKTDVIAALLKRLASLCVFYGIYFGVVDEDMLAALPKVKHRLFLTDYKAGAISTHQLHTKDDYLKKHKRLRRHLKVFSKAGGTIHIHEGPVDAQLADDFSQCVDSTYKYHGRKFPLNPFHLYASETCPPFFMTCQNAVHICAEIDGKIVGCQSFITHPDRLELSEGGFLRNRKNYHAYEAIIVASISYAIDHGLDSISYGGIWNHTKDRYTDKEDRTPIYVLAAYDKGWKYSLFGEWFVRNTILRGISFQFRGGGSNFQLVSSS